MAFAPGARCGPYRLLEALGQGGMGQVFRALDERLGREVALKLILAADAREERFLRRFLREGRLAASVDHPHVVRTLDVGAEGSTPYLALELLPGDSLADRLRERGRLPWREVARLGAQAARGLGAVHDAGLIHRDVKPDNLLLTADGAVKLADFGLVRSADPDARSLGGLTRTGELLGSPHYMAPEQVEGSRELDARADLYALGATLYALLAGRPPFEHTGYALLKQVLADPPPPLRGLAPDADPGLVALVTRLLAKSPDERPARAEEVAQALAALAAGSAVAPPGAGAAPPRARRALPQALGAVVALGASGVLLALAAGWGPAASSPPTPPPPTPTDAPSPSDPAPPPPAPAAPAQAALTPLGELSALLRSDRGHMRLRGVLGSPRWKTADWGFALAAAPDRRSFLVGGSGDCLLHCEASSGRLLNALRLPGRHATFGAVACSPEGDRALAVVGHEELALFDLLRGEALPPPPSHPGGYPEGTAVAFVPSSQRWALSAGGRTLRRWRPDDPATPPEAADVGADLLPALAVSPEGRWALLGSKASTALLWDLAAWRLHARLPIDGKAEVVSVAFSPDGRRAATGHSTGEAQVWDLSDPDRPRLDTTLRGHAAGEHVTSIAFAPGGRRLVTTCSDGTARTWDLAGREHRQLPLRSRGFRAAFLSDDEVLVLGCEEHLLRRWDLTTGEVTSAEPGHASSVTAVTYTPNGRRLASAGWDGALCVWDPERGALRGRGLTWDPDDAPRSDVRSSGLKSVLALPDGATVVTGGEDGLVRSWDLATTAQASLMRCPGPVRVVSRAADGALLAADQAGCVGLLRSDLTLEQAPVQVEATPDGRPDWIFGAGFVPGARREVLTATKGSGLRRWRHAPGSSPPWQPVEPGLSAMRGQPLRVMSLASYADQAFLGLADGQVLAVDLRTMTARGLLVDHQAAVQALALSADGRWAASASFGDGPDRSLRLWRTRDGDMLDLLDLAPAGDYVMALAFHPEGRWLAAGTARGVVLLLELSLPQDD